LLLSARGVRVKFNKGRKTATRLTASDQNVQNIYVVNMNYKTLIINWHTKAEQQDDIFSQFVFEYLAFIAMLKTQVFKGVNRDRDCIQKFKRLTKIQQKYLMLLNEDELLRHNWQVIFDELNNNGGLGTYSNDPFNVQEIGWWNCSHDELNQKTPEERKKFTGVFYGFDDWENMVEYWYTIRNNLFHGSKNPQGRRDQLAIEYGFKTLGPLVLLLLTEYFSIMPSGSTGEISDAKK